MGTTAVTFGDLAVLRTHLFVAQARAGGITLHQLDDATGTISTTPAATVELQTNLGEATLVGFDGTRMAMAAARNRIAIIWLTKAKLASGEPTGGWVLLKCNE